MRKDGAVVRAFEDLEVFQRAYRLALEVHDRAYASNAACKIEFFLNLI